MTDLDPKSFLDTTSNWFNILWLGVGSFLARLIIGRYLKTLDEIAESLKNLESRVARIEGRLRDKDHYDD